MSKTVTAALQDEFRVKTERLAELRPMRDSLIYTTERAERERDASHVMNGGFVSDEQEARAALVNATADRLRRVVSEKAEVEARLTELSKLLRSKDAAAAAADLVRKEQARVAAGQSKVTAHSERIASIEALRADALDGAARARAQAAAVAVAELPAEVRELLPASPDTSAPAGDALAHEARADALAEALTRAQSIGEQLADDLATAQQAEATATAELLTQRALVAELAHAESLAVYLVALGRYSELHDLAFGFRPQLPRFGQILEESRSEAMRAAQAEASADLEPGPLRRGIRRLAGVAGF